MTDEGIVMMATHNVRLVILSVVVAIIASIQPLSCLRVTVSVSALRCGWLVVRSLWELASGRCTSSRCLPITYRPITYNLPTVLVSMAVAGRFRGSSVRSQPSDDKWATVGSWGVFMGLGIAAMHYTGMDAIRGYVPV